MECTYASSPISLNSWSAEIVPVDQVNLCYLVELLKEV